jgi:hypothetical protein
MILSQLKFELDFSHLTNEKVVSNPDLNEALRGTVK